MSSDQPSTSAHPRAPHRRPWARAAAVTSVLALLAGCGLRWETPEPEPPVADATEQARQRAAATAVGLQVVAAGAATADPAVAAVLDQVATEATEHLAALGGLAPEREEPDPGAEGPTSPPPTGRSDPVTALTLLRDGYTSAREDAVQATNAPLARLLASIAAARLHGAVALATALAATPPPVPQDGPALVSSLVAVTDRQTAVTMTATHDGAAYAYEVLAARSTEEVRERALERARTHARLAAAWAAEEVAGTSADPRQVAFPVPPGLLDGDPETQVRAARELEEAVADAYATLAARIAPVERLGAVDLLALMSGAAREWGGPSTTFPGLPEQR